jgi:GAF domain-containing protein
VVIALAYTAVVIIGNLAVGRHQSLTGLLAITPVLVSFEWEWRATAAWSLLPLVVAGTDLFGYNQEPSQVMFYRLGAVAVGTALGLYASVDRVRVEAALAARRAHEDAQRQAETQAAEEHRRHAAAAALADAVGTEEVLGAIFTHAIGAVGGNSIGVWLLDPNGEYIRFGGGAGYVPGSPEAVASVPTGSDLPAAIVVREGRTVTYRSRQERDRRWPALAALATNVDAMAILPLRARGRVFGCLSIGFADQREFTDLELTALLIVSEECALALDRAVLLDAERQARRTLEFLAEGTALMVSSLEADEILQHLVRLAVPRLAEWCAVYVAENERFRRAALAVAGHPEASDVLAGGDEEIGFDVESAIAAAYRDGTIQVIPDVARVLGSHSGRYGVATRALLDQAGVRSAVAVPIVAGGKTIGAMTVGYAGDGAEHRNDFALLGLAGRAGIALDNARRYRIQLDVAQTLTAALLPDSLPGSDSLMFAARYIPASGGVAGDWYEAEPLSDGTILFGVGDAAGHGLAAASTMAQLRNGARALAMADMSPAQILGYLSRLVDDSPSKIATAIYGRIDPTTGRGFWSSAGHPPPLLTTAAGGTEFLDSATMALGVVDDPSYVDVPLVLAPGSTLVLVSDGVIERRDQSLDVGMAALRAAVARTSGRTPDEMADALAEEFCTEPMDDCCVLIVRYRG